MKYYIDVTIASVPITPFFAIFRHNGNNAITLNTFQTA